MIEATTKAVAGWAVTQLIYTYAERIDHGDFAGVGELFEHATLTFEGFDNEVRPVVRPSRRCMRARRGATRTGPPTPSTS